MRPVRADSNTADSGVNSELGVRTAPPRASLRVFNSALFITGPKMRSEQPLIRVTTQTRMSPYVDIGRFYFACRVR